MKELLVPRSLTSRGMRIKSIKGSIWTALKDIGRKVVISKGLVPKSFSFNFSFDIGRTRDMSFKRVTSILQKKILKDLPYSKYSLAKDIEPAFNTSLSFKIPLFEVTEADYHIMSNDVGRTSKEARLQRCLSSSGVQSGNENLLVHACCDDKFQGVIRYLCEQQRRIIRMDRNYRIAMEVGAINTHLGEKPYVLYLLISLRNSVLIEKGDGSKSLDPNTFQVNHGGGKVINSRPETLFFMIDDILQVVRTLSRKVNYDFNAFSFRAAETTTA